MMAQMTPELARRVARVRADNRSGASAVAVEAIAILTDARRSSPEMVDAVAAALCRAQPAMASVWNAAALALRPDGAAALVRYARRLTRAPDALARVAAGTLRAGHTKGETLSVATVSASRTVYGVLTELAGRGPLRVLCAEGRPLFEGRDLAAALAANGIGTTVCTDAAVGSLAASAHLVVVGADAVADRWFLNKCGTHQVVEVSASRGLSVYVVATREKLVHPGLAPSLRVSGGAAAEVWDGAPPAVEVANPYFERIPVDGLAGVITDTGVIDVDSLPSATASILTGDDVERLISVI